MRVMSEKVVVTTPNNGPFLTTLATINERVANCYEHGGNHAYN